MLFDEVAHPAAPSLRQLLGMAGGDQRMVWVLRQVPRRKQHRAVGALGAARRHEHHQAVDVVAGDGLELVDQQAVVGGGFEAGEAAELSEASARLPPRQQCLCCCLRR